MRSIILASASPRRVNLLKREGVEFTQEIADVEEIKETGGRDPREIAVENARLKAEAVRDKHPDSIIISADTIVLSDDNEILGKPADEEDARRILNELSDSTHSVVTGVVICRGEKEISFYEETRVTMGVMSEEDIQAYIDSGEPFGKAGAYAIQENADRFVTDLDGDFDNVVGLPVRRVLEELEKLQGQAGDIAI